MSTWAEMSPRERDALVAEHVMGQKPWCDDSDCPGCRATGTRNPVGINETRWMMAHPEMGRNKYTTDIAAAWDAVEKMEREKRMVSVEWHPTMKWRCEIFPPYPWRECTQGGERVHSTSHSASADTAPEAICLAALRAVGVEV